MLERGAIAPVLVAPTEGSGGPHEAPSERPWWRFCKVSPCQGIAPVEHRVVEYRRWCEGRTLIHKPA